MSATQHSPAIYSLSHHSATTLCHPPKQLRSSAWRLLLSCLLSTAKSGCEPKDATSLFAFVLRNCTHLHPTGLMTIGRLAPTPQPDCFRTLAQCRTTILTALAGEGVSAEGFEMSMGMSGDWEVAVGEGSTMVRIGSAIFGAREYGNKAGEKEDKNASEAKTAGQSGGGGGGGAVVAGRDDSGSDEEKSDGGRGR